MTSAQFNIRMVSHNEFLYLKNLFNSLVPPRKDYNCFKTGSSAAEVGPSMTEYARVCTAGMLIINGLKLHSHLCFHIVPPDDTEQSSISDFIKNTEAAFDHLDTLIRTNHFERGSTITVDSFYTGGYATDKESLDTQMEAETFVDSRIVKTKKLAKEQGVSIIHNKSQIFGHKNSSKYEASSNIYYDPEQNSAHLCLIDDKTGAVKDLNHREVYEFVEINANHKFITNPQ